MEEDNTKKFWDQLDDQYEKVTKPYENLNKNYQIMWDNVS